MTEPSSRISPHDVMAVKLNSAGPLEPGRPMSHRGLEPGALHRIWWQIAALLAISAFAVYAAAAFEEEKDKFLPELRLDASTYNKRQSGLLAVYELTSMIGQKVSTFERSYRQLPTSTNNMLIVISPTESLREFEISQILRFVERGNDLVYFDDFTLEMSHSILSRLKVKPRINSSEEKPKPIDVIPKGSLPELAHVKTMRLASAVRLDTHDGQTVAEDDSGAFITLLKHGKGRIWLGTVPDFLSNKNIAKKEYWGNFQLAANWFRTIGGTIYFDERAHGYTGGTNVFIYLSRGPAGLIFFQLDLILVIAVLSEARRFGAARRLDGRRKISNLEFINGLSNAYRRAKANPAVLEILFHAFKNKLSRTLAVSPHEPTERLVEAWSQSKHAGSFNLAALLKQYEEFMTRREVKDSDLKTMIASCDKINESTQDSLTILSTKPRTGGNN